MSDIKVGDRVRITEKYRETAEGEKYVGVEFNSVAVGAVVSARKRFKVVQDARGQWGIYDNGHPWQDASFASFGREGGMHIDMIVGVAVQLNRGEMNYPELHWGWYYPRPNTVGGA